MANKLITVQEAVERYTWDGMQYAQGAGISVGSDSTFFGREMIRQGRKHLHMLTHCCTQQLNLFCAAGAVDKIETAFTGLEVYGFPYGLKRAVESGKVEIEDYSNLAFGLRVLAGSMNWPFCPTISGYGSDQEMRSGFKPDEYPCKTKIPQITDPFTGKPAYVLSPLKPDLSVIHVTMADVNGNAIMLGTDWCRPELARGSKKVIIQAELIVDTDCMRQFPNLVRIPDFLSNAVIYAPFGAWPHCSTGLYDSDEEHFYYMNNCMKTDEGFIEYKTKYIDSYKTIAEYLAVLGDSRLAKIKDTVTAHLMDPYRKWIMSDEQIMELTEGTK